MTYLSVENLSKQFGGDPLFEGLTFRIGREDKTALVAENGSGKSTLLKILAGKETPETGEVMIQKGITTGYLEQGPLLDDTKTIREYIATGHSGLFPIVERYLRAVDAQAEDFNEVTQKEFGEATAEMEAAGAWDYEQRLENILSIFNIRDLDQPIKTLSGGERKRVALAFLLIDEPDLLLLDEPTNHLDVEMIEWLENYLLQTRKSIFMVTHDRYFLDRVCNQILELESSHLYQHNGNYSYFLEKKAEREEAGQTRQEKVRQLYKKELEWMRRGPKARTSKSKTRKDAFYEIEKQALSSHDTSEIRLEADMARLGRKILELKNVYKKFDDTVILDDFSYSFSRGERIGIIGKNGVGKSSFLNLLTGSEPVDSGEIIVGETIVFGHYTQRGITFNEEERVIDIMKDIAHVVKLADGSEISASRFLEHFMFSPDMQYTPAAKLSGGEKRRLGLMMTLIKNPNFLILDEPTNDLDLTTLQKLEEFLESFGGCLILVSHDRFFMDKLVDHYFTFEGDGVIGDFHGTYEEYREEVKKREAEERRSARVNSSGSGRELKSETGKSATEKQKLTFTERKEMGKLEKEIESLEEKKSHLIDSLNDPSLEYPEQLELSKEVERLDLEIGEKTSRWMELAERDL